MNYVYFKSAEKEIFPCAFLLFPEETNDEKKDFNRSHFITLRMDIYV